MSLSSLNRSNSKAFRHILPRVATVCEGMHYHKTGVPWQMNKTLIINFSLYFLIYFAQKAFILAICTMVNQVTNNNKLIIMGECSYVLTTHTDKGHVHNHLIFCSADDITFSHYHDCKKNYWKIRNLSDTLCKEHNLSTIMPNGKKGMKYNEWAANKSESSKKHSCEKISTRQSESFPLIQNFLH